MTSKLTRERLQELAAGQSGFNLRTATHEESQELARMALTAMDSEPVAYSTDWDACRERHEQAENAAGILKTLRSVAKRTASLFRQLGYAPSAKSENPVEVLLFDAEKVISELEKIRAAMPKAEPLPGIKAVPALGSGPNLPERIEKDLLDACCTFLKSCGYMGKNYDSSYYDSETDYYVSLYKIAESLGIVKCIGNRSWQFEKAISDDINAVYKKYAALMLAAAPAVNAADSVAIPATK